MKKYRPDLKKIWRNRRQIFDGVANTIFKKKFVEQVAEYRMKICKECKWYDGECEVPGTGPCCGACGCSLKFKVRSLSTFCGLTNIGRTPLWMPVMKQEDEDKYMADVEIDTDEDLDDESHDEEE